MPKYTWLEVLQDKWWIGVLSLVVSLIAAPILRAITYHFRNTAHRDDFHNSQKRPVACFGGIVICIGLLAGLGGFLTTMPDLNKHWAQIWPNLSGAHFRVLSLNPLWNLICIATAGVTVAIFGLLGDLKKMTRKWQIYGQLMAACILLAGGIGIRMGNLVLGYLGLDQILWILLPVSVVMCITFVIMMSNTTRFMDDFAGLSGGVTGIVALCFLVLAVWLAMWNHLPDMDELRVVLCLAMAGAVLGFLPYNIPPANIFLGNAGSMLMGFFVATMMIMFCQENHPRWFIAAIIIFTVPIFDTAIAVVRRIKAKRSLFVKDRSHLHNQLVDRGMTVKQVVTLFYIMSLFTGIVGVVVSVYIRLRYAVPIYLILLAGLWILFSTLGLTTPGTKLKGIKPLMPPGPLNILFTSVGRRVSLQQEFRRAAADLGIQLIIHAADCNELAPALDAADKSFRVPRVDSADYIPCLLDYCRKNNISALIPLIDPELLPLSETQDEFAGIGTQVIISSEEVVKICTDKGLTGKFFVAKGFRTPHILTPEEIQSPQFPLFIKPRHGSASIETHKLTTQDDLSYYTHLLSDMIVQEFIEGTEYTVDVFADFDGRAQCAVPRRRLAVRAGEISKGQVEKNAQIMEVSCRVVEALGGCKGPITVQCFLTPQEEIVLTEINPRFGGGVPLSIRAGADSPRWILELLLGRQPTMAMRGWSDGLVMLRYDQEIFVKSEDQSANQTT